MESHRAGCSLDGCSCNEDSKARECGNWGKVQGPLGTEGTAAGNASWPRILGSPRRLPCPQGIEPADQEMTDRSVSLWAGVSTSSGGFWQKR